MVCRDSACGWYPLTLPHYNGEVIFTFLNVINSFSDEVWCIWCSTQVDVGSVRKFSLETAFWHNIQYLIPGLMTWIKIFSVEKLQIKSARYSLLHSLVCSAIITLLTWFPDFHARCSQLTLCVTLNRKLLDADIVFWTQFSTLKEQLQQATHAMMDFISFFCLTTKLPAKNQYFFAVGLVSLWFKLDHSQWFSIFYLS